MQTFFLLSAGDEASKGHELQCGGVRHGAHGAHAAAAVLPSGGGAWARQTHAAQV